MGVIDIKGILKENMRSSTCVNVINEVNNIYEEYGHNLGTETFVLLLTEISNSILIEIPDVDKDSLICYIVEYWISKLKEKK